MENEKIIPFIYDDLIARSKKSSYILNKFINEVLERERVKKVWDVSCGTGNQAIFLAKKGYDVLASDIDGTMLKLAKKKSEDLKIKWKIGNMKNLVVRKSDAIISIYNSVLHLNENDLMLAFDNFYNNLNKNGILIFDLFNENLLKKKFPKHKFIQNISKSYEKKCILFNKISYNQDIKLMTSHFELYTQKDLFSINKNKFKIEQYIYSKGEILASLKRAGFHNISIYDSKGRRFNENKSIFLLIIAKK